MDAAEEKREAFKHGGGSMMLWCLVASCTGNLVRSMGS